MDAEVDSRDLVILPAEPDKVGMTDTGADPHNDVLSSSSEVPPTIHHLSPNPRSYSHHMRQLRMQFQGVDFAELERFLPRDAFGCVTSIGSTLHGSGNCKPCKHALLSEPCIAEIQCLFCHMEHPICSHLAFSCLPLDAGKDDTKCKMRKGKLQRQRYQRLVEKITQQIEKDPLKWTTQSMLLPRFVECNPELERKLLIRVATIAEGARCKAMSKANQVPR